MIRSALVVVDPYASLIMSGEKTLELRAAPTRKRELVGIIRKGSGFIVGLARVSGCSGPLGDAELDALRARHLVPADDLAKRPAWRWGWELEAAWRLPEPVAYRHPNGAQSWVSIADPGLRLRIARQCDAAIREVRRCAG